METLALSIKLAIRALWYLPIVVGCVSLITRNVHLLEGAGDSLTWTLFIYGVIVWICLAMGDGLYRLLAR